MKPWELLGRATTPADDDLTLMRRDGEYVIFANGKSLMTSRMHGSEEALATLACRRARSLDEPCVLVGGLGMGFTLRAAARRAAIRPQLWLSPSSFLRSSTGTVGTWAARRATR